MWNLLDDDGSFPSDARHATSMTEAPSNVLPIFGTPLPVFGTPDDDGVMGWQERALCAQTDPEAFFPEKGGSTREAKKVCTGCDVRSECLEYALAHDERFGIWGGLSERERRKLKRRVV
ncbi:WhiB family transcriptional regulator [Cellulomonas sp.]|uniref:WhiB family transcriptional regulator n=1 Tax=Cellulomonas sp. TaxID=40001 RepID=UPI0039C8A3B0